MWLQKLESFGVRKSFCEPTDEILEIAQRRHAIVHHNGRVSRNYKRHSKQADGLSLGDAIVIDPGYLHSSLTTTESTFLRYVIGVLNSDNGVSGLQMRKLLWSRAHTLFIQGEQTRARPLFRLVNAISGKADATFKLARLHALWFEKDREDFSRELRLFQVDPGDERQEAYLAAMRGDRDYLSEALPKLVSSGIFTRSEIRNSPIFTEARTTQEIIELLRLSDSVLDSSTTQSNQE